MTLRYIALATALTSAAAVAAPAAFAQDSAQRIDDPDIGTHVGDLPKANADLPEVPNDIDVEATAPSELDLMGKELTEAEKTLVKNILVEAENGATLSSVDDYVIGEVTGTLGNAGSDHLIYVDVSQEAGLAADRLAFRASALSVERVGDLEYAMTLQDLRKDVAERVAALRM
ncbi:phosphoribosylglycinamide synthetase [Roseovarius ramblicola]|uniref:Phosphoribosylglycinamide synthetase n=1 Tax=Roseovarius ramblicola TaxID=2022336 RepID=A0ABV5I346_9RHOB